MSAQYHDTLHKVAVGVYDIGERTPRAKIKAYTYPDGTPQNSLTADELREIAEMLTTVADEMDSGEQ